MLHSTSNYFTCNKLIIFTLIRSFRRSQKKKRELPDDEQYTWRIKTEKQMDIAYDYEQFKLEYDEDRQEMKNKEAKLNETEFEIQQKVEEIVKLYVKIDVPDVIIQFYRK